jgi:DNA replication protein DnaC
MTLADGSFIERPENILITGPTGCGKSYLACALGRQACSLGYRVLYFGMNRFIEKVSQTKLDGTFIKLLNHIEKTHLLIFDDFGIHPFDAITRLALLQILEDRYGKRAVMITSQLPFAKWYEFIGEPTLADAIMDRLAGNAHRIELKGESLRKHKIDKKD